MPCTALREATAVHFRSVSIPKYASWRACRVWKLSSAVVIFAICCLEPAGEPAIDILRFACDLLDLHDGRVEPLDLLFVERTSSFLQSKSCHGSALPVKNILTVSAPNSLTASSSRKTFPFEEDIFAPFKRPMPKTTMPLGSLSFVGKSSVVEDLEGEVVLI